MDIYKIAKNEDPVAIFYKSLKTLPMKDGKSNDPQGRMIDLTREFHYETELGDMYIQIYCDKKSNKIAIERYFDNEIVQEQYGVISYVDIMDDISTTQRAIMDEMYKLNKSNN